MTFLDMFVTGGGNNNPGYSNPEYDKLIATAKSETNNDKRTAAMHQAEDILFNDMPVIPLYYYSNVSVIKSNIKGIENSALGFVYFRNTTVE